MIRLVDNLFSVLDTFLSTVYNRTNHLEKILSYLKMNESNTYSNLNAVPLRDQTKSRLNEIDKIKDYFNSEIQERKVIK